MQFFSLSGENSFPLAGMQIPKLDIENFLKTSDNAVVLDVRTPSEFKKGHIPFAKNFPLFSDDERAEIGKIYKHQGQSDAILRGLEVVGPRLKDMVVDAQNFNSKRLYIHCWRGGMRSEYVAKLLGLAGFNVATLEGGYRAYKRAQIELYSRRRPYLVLSGYTGSRKTEILHNLAEHGEQVVDLEGLANHQGSSFGNQKSDHQPSTEQFHNDLYEVMRVFNDTQPVWIEDESFSIGRVHLPSALYRIKNESPHIVIEVPKEERVKFLLEEYGEISTDKLVLAVEGIKRKLGGDRFKLVLEHLDNNDGVSAANQILHYYDKRYREAIARKENLVVATIKSDGAKQHLVEELLKAAHVH